MQRILKLARHEAATGRGESLISTIALFLTNVLASTVTHCTYMLLLHVDIVPDAAGALQLLHDRRAAPATTDHHRVRRLGLVGNAVDRRNPPGISDTMQRIFLLRDAVPARYNHAVVVYSRVRPSVASRCCIETTERISWF